MLRLFSFRSNPIRPLLARSIAREDWKALLLVVFLTALLSGLIYYRRIIFPSDSDFGTHLYYARLMIRGDFEDIPLLNLTHPGLQFLLVAMYFLSFRVLNPALSLIAVLTLTQVLTGLVLYFYWFQPQGDSKDQPLRLFWAFTLSFVGPVMLLQLWDGLYYFGYIGLGNYHNPTIIMLRPLVLVSSLLAFKIFNGSRSSTASIIFSGLLIVFSALIKPNYALTLMLALGALGGCYWLAKKRIDWRMLSLGFGAPAVLILALQWVFLYLLSSQTGDGIIWSPFDVERAYSENIFLKFLLSILFPLSVYLLHIKDIIKRPEMQLAGLIFLAGAFQVYFLAEGGERFYHGNFRWSVQIALFILFAACARYLYTHKGHMTWQGKWIPLALYLAHLLAGAAYYIHTLISQSYA